MISSHGLLQISRRLLGFACRIQFLASQIEYMFQRNRMDQVSRSYIAHMRVANDLCQTILPEPDLARLTTLVAEFEASLQT